MKKIETGRTPVTPGVWAAILSLSLVVNLPGLAVTPMLAQLKTNFPHSTQFEEQLLSLIPNLMILPFILLSGRLSLTRHRRAVVVGALILFVASSLAYFLAVSMLQLIIISAFLGAAAGLIIPFSTGFISDTFTGRYRTRQMGFQSGISNLTLVLATFAVGLLGTHNWHLPFIVYLVALIPLALTPLLKKVPKPVSDSQHVSATGSGKSPYGIGKTWQIIGVYFLITFISMVFPLFAPYLVQSHGWEESITGTATSVFFLFIFLPGFFLTPILRRLKGSTIIISTAMIATGTGLTAFAGGEWALIAGAGICGLGYGIYQPIIYDKASTIIKDRATQVLSIVLAANYLAIVFTPEIIDLVRSICRAGNAEGFPFVFNFFVGVGLVLMAVFMRSGFAFRPEKVNNV